MKSKKLPDSGHPAINTENNLVIPKGRYVFDGVAWVKDYAVSIRFLVN